MPVKTKTKRKRKASSKKLDLNLRIAIASLMSCGLVVAYLFFLIFIGTITKAGEIDQQNASYVKYYSGPTPLLINDLYDARVHLITEDTVTMGFLSNSVNLGSLDLHTNTFTDGYWAPTSTLPLAVTLTQSATTTIFDMPAKVINVITNTYDLQSLCVPRSQIGSGGAGVVYYFDTEGTPYYDVALTQRATEKSCLYTTSNALNVNDILYSTLSNTATPSSSEPLSAYFMNSGIDLGVLDFSDNSYTDFNTGATTTAPLSVWIAHDNPFGSYEMKQRDIEIWVPGNQHTLCIPASQVDGQSAGDPTVFYYNSNGRPFSDALLNQKILCKSSVSIPFDF